MSINSLDHTPVHQQRVDELLALISSQTKEIMALRAECRRISERHEALREAAYRVCSTAKIDPEVKYTGEGIPESTKAMRSLANQIDFPSWWSLA